MQQELECLGLIKTSKKCYPALQERLLEWHPYDTPELIAVDITNGSPAYLSWVQAQSVGCVVE